MEPGSPAAVPNPVMLAPFGLLLGLIALAPLFFAGWWSRHYPKVALALGAITAGYYLLGLQAGGKVIHTAVEYVGFISLVGSLFVVSGGILIRVKGEATPFENVLFLFFGAIIANVLGTTGASMLLIRPWIRMNRYRITGHHVVFFIFVVSNVGGCLTPIGDPPLFLGYLKGIPFWWVAEHCWPVWLTALALLLGIFHLVDTRNYLRAPKAVRVELAEPADTWRFEGGVNVIFLAVILGAVFVSGPPFLREGLMLAAAAGSYFLTPRRIHAANDFNFHPVQEVAILFVGIFATMMPALDLLETHARGLGSPPVAFFYWGSGVLSSVLDNAPTYLCFLKAIVGAYVDADIVEKVGHLASTGGVDLAGVVQGEHGEQIRSTWTALTRYMPGHVAAKTVSVEDIEIAFLLGNGKFNHFIVAVSCGAVFFGANTYIGNGPNFMVKAIAEQNRVHTPDFLSYVWKYALPVMFPMLAIVWLAFFR
jgi:Na+/H+ antiporter NhaD/arsenite permease-like protein